MMRLVEKKIRQIAALAGRWPYKTAYSGLKVLGRVYKIPGEIWIRNSYVLGSFEPGFSDLDLTLFVFEKLISDKNQNSVESFLNAARFFQKLWPFLGEINLYNQETAEIVMRIHNSFEVRRDPELVKRFSYEKSSDMYEAAVFLLRQLDKDLLNLRTRPEKRMKKWQSHFNEIDRAFPDLKFKEKFPLDSTKMIESIVNAILFLSRIWNPIMVEDARHKFLFFIELKLAKIDSYKMKKIAEWDSWFFVWGIGFFSNAHLGQSRLSEDQLKIFVRQIRWELCGILSQCFTKQQKIDSFRHLKKLYESLGLVENLHSHEEIRDLKQAFDSSFFFCQN